MIYLDSSVVLAQLLAEEGRPDDRFWSTGPFVSSRLLQYEVWVWIHARGLENSHGEDVNRLLAGLDLLELAPPVLARALEPFPVPVRTLDALHLASIEFLRGQGQRPELATYDRRQAEAATALGISLTEVTEG